jgi:hypothetical protein
VRVFFFRLKAKLAFFSQIENPKFHTFQGRYLREERFREAYDVITEELSSSSSLKFARQRERERKRERKEHTRTRNLKPREREQQRIKKAVIVMFFAQQQHHHHLSSNSISISSVTTKRIR